MTMVHDVTGCFVRKLGDHRVELNWRRRSPRARVGVDMGRADLALDSLSDEYFAVGDVLGFCKGDEAGTLATLNASYQGAAVSVFNLQAVHQQIEIAGYGG